MIEEVEVAASGATAEEVAAVRELILRAHPDVVPELVTGATIAELTGSIAGARAAYEAVVGRQAAVAGGPPSVPAGGAAMVIDPASLPATEKIRRGLAGR